MTVAGCTTCRGNGNSLSDDIGVDKGTVHTNGNGNGTGNAKGKGNAVAGIDSVRYSEGLSDGHSTHVLRNQCIMVGWAAKRARRHSSRRTPREEMERVGSQHVYARNSSRLNAIADESLREVITVPSTSIVVGVS